MPLVDDLDALASPRHWGYSTSARSLTQKAPFSGRGAGCPMFDAAPDSLLRSASDAPPRSSRKASGEYKALHWRYSQADDRLAVPYPPEPGHGGVKVRLSADSQVQRTENLTKPIWKR